MFSLCQPFSPSGAQLAVRRTDTGGNPILAFSKDSSKVLFDDMLGNTLGSLEGGKFSAINRTAFGSVRPTADSDNNAVRRTDFFTGKPQVEGLGYAFMFRNYRAEQGKWQTADPIGYPDGWNNLAYCNNNVIHQYDALGLDSDLPSFTFSASASFSTSSNSSGVSISLSSITFSTPPSVTYPDTGYENGWWRYAYRNFTVSYSGMRDNCSEGFELFTYTYSFLNGGWQLTFQSGTNGLSLDLGSSTSVSITASWEMQMIIFIGHDVNDPQLGQNYDYVRNGSQPVSYKKVTE
ncbi:MAG: RHS repeat-associated core domain-containing protein [Victivallaceae bacterium]